MQHERHFDLRVKWTYTTTPKNLERNVFMMFILPKSCLNDEAVPPLIPCSFFGNFQIPKLLRQFDFSKEKGVPVSEVFLSLFQLVFTGMNLYRPIEMDALSIRKDYGLSISQLLPVQRAGSSSCSWRGRS